MWGNVLPVLFFIAVSSTFGLAVPVDKSLVPLCIRVIQNDSSVQTELEKHPLVKKMSEGMHEQVQFSPKEFTHAAFFKKKDSRFSWTKLRSPGVLKFIDYLEDNLQSLVPKSIGRATEFIDETLNPSDLQINIVCGGSWDAYVLYFSNKPEIFLDIGWFAGNSTKKLRQQFQSILTHELWHAAFRKHWKKHWNIDYKDSSDPMDQFFYEFVNEGVGHYYSFHHRVYPKMGYIDFKARTKKLFARFDKKYTRYRAEKNKKERTRLLWQSHAGVPFWEKWGATSGAVVMYHLVKHLGKEKAKKLIEKNPFQLVIQYEQMTKSHKHLPKLPPKFVSDAKKKLKEVL